MRALLVAVVFTAALASASAAQADDINGYEQRDVKTYGKCHVITNVDLLTDEEHYGFACERATDTFGGSIYMGIISGHFNGQPLFSSCSQ